MGFSFVLVSLFHETQVSNSNENCYNQPLLRNKDGEKLLKASEEWKALL